MGVAIFDLVVIAEVAVLEGKFMVGRLGLAGYLAGFGFIIFVIGAFSLIYLVYFCFRSLFRIDLHD